MAADESTLHTSSGSVGDSCTRPMSDLRLVNYATGTNHWPFVSYGDRSSGTSQLAVHALIRRCPSNWCGELIASALVLTL